MKKLSLYVNSLILLFLIVTFTPITQGQVKDIEPSLYNVMQQNRVIVTCYDRHDNIWGGQGTITQVDSLGVWVTTAEHVTHDSDHCDVMFRDGSNHVAHVSKAFERADVSILFSSRAYWPTRATMEPIKIGEKLYAFGEALTKWDRNKFGWIVGFMFDFNDKLYDGKALTKMPASFMGMYNANKENLVLTNVYSAPGSSGGGIFNAKGNFVGLVSGGSEVDHYCTYIVDVSKSYDDEFTATPKEKTDVIYVH